MKEKVKIMNRLGRYEYPFVGLPDKSNTVEIPDSRWILIPSREVFGYELLPSTFYDVEFIYDNRILPISRIFNSKASLMYAKIPDHIRAAAIWFKSVETFINQDRRTGTMICDVEMK